MKTRVFALPKTPINPSPDGKKMLALEVGESFLMEYTSPTRPSGPAETGIFGKVFRFEPLPPPLDCLKVTRVK